MKRIIFVIISILIIFFVWPEPELGPGNEPVEEEQILEPETVVEEDSGGNEQYFKRAPEPSPIRAETVQVSNPSKTSNGRSLPPGAVEFELLSSGWAVTHGDILLGKLQTKIEGTRGQFKPKPSVLWENSQIPYAFGEGFTKMRVKEVVETLDEMSRLTNVDFYLVDIQDLPKDYILFTPSTERCASYLGKVGGQQPIFLKEECGPKEIRHEAMHALGFVHEQSRKDRDQYVKVNWENIKSGFENQFDIAPDAYLENYRGFVFSFDYQSVMLYSPFHFAKSSDQKTIESKTNKEIAPSQSSLSPVDIQRINYLYSN